MHDPLGAFDWSQLYALYDCKCRRFDATSAHLRAVHPRAESDRDLYHHLVRALKPETRRPPTSSAKAKAAVTPTPIARSDGIHAPVTPADAVTRVAVLPARHLTADMYEALLYWKHYSGRFGIKRFVRSLADGAAVERMRFLLTRLPESIERDVKQIEELIRLVGRSKLPGMASPSALPTRTTFLHFVYPDVIPVFDQMVLKAVGAWQPRANEDPRVMASYIPHAWLLADKYAPDLTEFAETPTRLVDMALWVLRDLDTRSPSRPTSLITSCMFQSRSNS